MFNVCFECKGYEIKEIKNYTPTSAGLIISKKYIDCKIGIVPICGILKTEYKEGVTKIIVETKYIKEVVIDDKGKPNKIYLPKEYAGYKCVVCIMFDD